MHIPDGFTSMEINAGALAIVAGVTAIAIRGAKKDLGDKQAPMLGVTAAFIFAAQMINFPVAAGTSGHFLGAMLAAALLGPLNAFLIMEIILTFQCLLFSDGGLTALGVNIFNMGIAGGILSYSIFAALRAIAPKNRAGFLFALSAASWLSVVLASAACSLELSFSNMAQLKLVLPAIVGVHTIIGAGEAIITAAVVSLVLGARPDLVQAWRPPASSIGSRIEVEL